MRGRINFNPRSREGSDFHVSPLCDFFQISIHAPARGATGLKSEWEKTQLISIHAPARGATKEMWKYSQAVNISIHAPARGATHNFMPDFQKNKISIHAPARGATIVTFDISALKDIFQSTLPRGERRFIVKRLLLLLLISIHAPARGATANTHKQLI